MHTPAQHDRISTRESVVHCLRTFCLRTENRRALLMSGIVALIVTVMLLSWVGKAFYGNLYWALWPSAFFGVPDHQRSVYDLVPFFRNDRMERGFDGQFYYYISDDLLIQGDAKNHLGSPGYRYQRIGVPLLAKCISSARFEAAVSPSSYFFAVILPLLFGVFYLSVYLARNGLPASLVLTWALSFGVLFSSATGVVDGAAGAAALIALISILDGKHWAYSIWMTFACLTKNEFALIGVPIAIMAVVWPRMLKFTSRWTASLFASLPILIVTVWAAYVRAHLGLVSMNNAFIVVNLPLRSLFKFLALAIDQGSFWESISLELYLLLLAASIIVFCATASRRPVFLALLPYCVLLASLGDPVANSRGNYLRPACVLAGLLLLALPAIKNSRSRIAITILLLVNTAWSCALWYELWTGSVVRTPYKYDSHIVQPRFQKISNYECDIQPLAITLRPDANIIFAGLFVPDYLAVQVRLKNLTDVVLLRSLDLRGYGVRAYYLWLDAAGARWLDTRPSARSSLPVDLPVHASTEFPVLVTVPSAPGKYTLRISLLQEGVAEFPATGTCKADIPISIPIDARQLQQAVVGWQR
jgi:hypothetical protein